MKKKVVGFSNFFIIQKYSQSINNNYSVHASCISNRRVFTPVLDMKGLPLTPPPRISCQSPRMFGGPCAPTTGKHLSRCFLSRRGVPNSQLSSRLPPSSFLHPWRTGQFHRWVLLAFLQGFQNLRVQVQLLVRVDFDKPFLGIRGRVSC